MSNISEIQKTSDCLCILGNGPSLKVSLEKYESLFVNGGMDVIVVNNVVYSDWYERIKPKYHMYMDPNLFIPQKAMSEYLENDAKKFIQTFVNKVKWDVFFIVPSFAKDTWVLEKVKDNPFIHPFFINTLNFSDYENELDKFRLWDKNYLSVPAQTVLNTCLYFGIFKRYKEIYLLGADSNWIEQIHVNQDTNQVYSVDEHFYGKEIRPLFSDVEGKIPAKLYEELSSNSTTLRLYWELKAYADYAGVKVFNASEYSLIDAFERKKPSLQR